MNVHPIEVTIISKLSLPNNVNFPTPLLVGVAFESALGLDPEEDEVKAEAGGESLVDCVLESACLKILASGESGGRLSKAANNTCQHNKMMHNITWKYIYNTKFPNLRYLGL